MSGGEGGRGRGWNDHLKEIFGGGGRKGRGILLTKDSPPPPPLRVFQQAWKNPDLRDRNEPRKGHLPFDIRRRWSVSGAGQRRGVVPRHCQVRRVLRDTRRAITSSTCIKNQIQKHTCNARFEKWSLRLNRLLKHSSFHQIAIRLLSNHLGGVSLSNTRFKSESPFPSETSSTARLWWFLLSK